MFQIAWNEVKNIVFLNNNFCFQGMFQDHAILDRFTSNANCIDIYQTNMIIIYIYFFYKIRSKNMKLIIFFIISCFGTNLQPIFGTDLIKKTEDKIFFIQKMILIKKQFSLSFFLLFVYLSAVFAWARFSHENPIVFCFSICQMIFFVYSVKFRENRKKGLTFSQPTKTKQFSTSAYEHR